jgi:hypothetical protein
VTSQKEKRRKKINRGKEAWTGEKESSEMSRKESAGSVRIGWEVGSGSKRKMKTDTDREREREREREKKRQ